MHDRLLPAGLLPEATDAASFCYGRTLMKHHSKPLFLHGFYTYNICNIYIHIYCFYIRTPKSEGFRIFVRSHQFRDCYHDMKNNIGLGRRAHCQRETRVLKVVHGGPVRWRSPMVTACSFRSNRSVVPFFFAAQKGWPLNAARLVWDWKVSNNFHASTAIYSEIIGDAN